MDDRPEPTMTQVKIRCRDDLKRRLEAEAKAEKRSINDVVISRLESSYSEQDGYSSLIKERFGDEKSYKTLCAIASAWDLISSVRGTPWHSFAETVEMASAAASYTINLTTSGLPAAQPSLADNDAEKARRDLRTFVGFQSARLAVNDLEGLELDPVLTGKLVEDLEALRKLDVIAWHEAERNKPNS